MRPRKLTKEEWLHVARDQDILATAKHAHGDYTAYLAAAARCSHAHKMADRAAPVSPKAKTP